MYLNSNCDNYNMIYQCLLIETKKIAVTRIKQKTEVLLFCLHNTYYDIFNNNRKKKAAVMSQGSIYREVSTTANHQLVSLSSIWCFPACAHVCVAQLNAVQHSEVPVHE